MPLEESISFVAIAAAADSLIFALKKEALDFASEVNSRNSRILNYPRRTSENSNTFVIHTGYATWR